MQLRDQLSFSRKKNGALAGLDIEAGSVAVAEASGNGSGAVAAAIQPLPPGVFHEGEVADADGLVTALKELYGQGKFSKRVRLGVANQRVIVRTLRLPAIEDQKEMDAAVRFQAQEHIPMPLEHAVLEHQVVGGVPAAEGSTPQVDVVVIAARRDMVSSFLEPLRRAGLEPAAVDLSAFGMIRALAGSETGAGDEGPTFADAAPDGGAGDAAPADVSPAGDEAVLYCNVGDVMNLAVARRRACLFTRVSGAGIEAIVGRLVGERSLTPAHAREWLLHVGLEPAVEQVEGDAETVAAVRRILEEGVTGLVDELRLSLDYYHAQESAVPISRVVLCGPGSAIAGLPGTIEAHVNLPIVAARPPALSSFDESSAARLTLAYGLALEN